MLGPPSACFAPPPSAPSATSALHASLPPALAPTMTTPIVDAPSSSVHQSSTPCLAPASRQPLGLSPPATSPAHAVLLRVVGASFASSSLPVTPFMFTTLPTITAMSRTAPVTTTAVNVSVMTIMARQLDRGARCNSKQLAASPRRPDCLPSPPYRIARLAAFGDIARAHAGRFVDTRREHARFRVRLAAAGFALHRLPHFAILYCPFHCRRLCTSLRQCARHDRLQFPLHSPPLSRRGGSRPPGPPAPIPLRLNPWFVVPDRVPRLWFSHPTQQAARVAHAPSTLTLMPPNAAHRRPVLVGSSRCSGASRLPR